MCSYWRFFAIFLLLPLVESSYAVEVDTPQWWEEQHHKLAVKNICPSSVFDIGEKILSESRSDNTECVNNRTEVFAYMAQLARSDKDLQKRFVIVDLQARKFIRVDPEAKSDMMLSLLSSLNYFQECGLLKSAWWRVVNPSKKAFSLPWRIPGSVSSSPGSQSVHTAQANYPATQSALYRQRTDLAIGQ